MQTHKPLNMVIMVNIAKSHVKRNFVKEGLVAKLGEVDRPKLMVSVKRNVKPFEW